ncbi:hypothetical protein MAR_018353 [Mya arenaria]|uniref:Uncharacterized protein n=1 Tax=Mya arenaria TaxID=6604 RepID=A0ABY7EH01_MYAAR|nr:hypothetical protein MAR_018353 [Mya arenaria]
MVTQLMSQWIHLKLYSAFQEDLKIPKLYIYSSKEELNQYKSAIHHETVRPKVIYDLTKYFVNNELYKEGMQLSEEWCQYKENPEVCFATNEDLKDLKNTHKDDDQKADQHDTWTELNDQEQAGAGNKDTLLQNTDFTDDGVHALQIAPSENRHPIGLFMDTCAEKILFAAQKRCTNDNRLVPVKYSSICKAEMRNVDERFACSVANIFFIFKQLQALKDMATTALRKSKNVSFTAGQLKSSIQIENILKHDEGFRFLKTLRSSPSYYQT